MSDKTSRDIRVGDLSAVEATGIEPRIGNADAVDTAGSARRQPGAPASRRPASGAPGGQQSWPLIVLGVLVMLLICVVVVLVFKQRELSASLASLDAKAKASVETLESRVASTSTTLKSADSETQRSLNLLATDIANLDKTLGRLAKALEQEAKAREALGTELGQFAAETRKGQQAAAQATTQLESRTDSRLKATGDSLEQHTAKLKTLADGLARLERSGDAAQLRSEVSVLGATVRQLQEDSEKRLKAVEQSAGSNDAFRRQVNTTIDRLNQQVTELYQRR